MSWSARPSDKVLEFKRVQKLTPEQEDAVQQFADWLLNDYEFPKKGNKQTIEAYVQTVVSEGVDVYFGVENKDVEKVEIELLDKWKRNVGQWSE